ncbi:hypothetical protein HPB49_012439 [Dermacentor silvarum]|uniref:Uncharacterized protein n=1 Tax=Dermacentor silvarum TaxID=543639 RepID=A0ACB8C925_DERSI|nr:hypothetical protein HPB49_012439 [Dermacentor silvarum]
MSITSSQSTGGRVTYEDVVNVLPFGNTLVVMNVSGAQLRDLLEHGAHRHDAKGEVLPAEFLITAGKTPRSRECHIVGWRAFRRLCHQDTSGRDFLQLVVDRARASIVTTTAQIQELCSEPIRIHELEAALSRTKRRSTPGADGITFQMLRNLEEAGRQRLLEGFNDIWSTGDIPESWRAAVVARILRPRKPATALPSYRPVSLTSAACKVLERVALARLEWIAAQLQFFTEEQTGFRCYCCTADSIADVVATLEDAKRCGDVAMLLLLDVESAFDGLPHTVVEAAMDGLGFSGCLRGFVTAFLSGRTFRVRVGRELSEPRDITSVVPQGSVLSPLLFNPAGITPSRRPIPGPLLHQCGRCGTLGTGTKAVHPGHQEVAAGGPGCGRLRVVYDLQRKPYERVVDALILCADCRVPRYEPLEGARRYRVAALSYIVHGGDNFNFSFVAPTDMYDTGFKDDQIVVHYMNATSPLTTAVDGRVTFLKLPTGQAETSASDARAAPAIYSHLACLLLCVFYMFQDF